MKIFYIIGFIIFFKLLLFFTWGEHFNFLKRSDILKFFINLKLLIGHVILYNKMNLVSRGIFPQFFIFFKLWKKIDRKNKEGERGRFLLF